jgi:hypothetical protein
VDLYFLSCIRLHEVHRTFLLVNLTERHDLPVCEVFDTSSFIVRGCEKVTNKNKMYNKKEYKCKNEETRTIQERKGEIIMGRWRNSLKDGRTGGWI